MSEKKSKTRTRYSEEFKAQAIELAKEIGSKEAAEKLGIKNFQTLAAWLRYSQKIEEDDSFRELERLRSENKRLMRELETERKSVAILKDATAFFCHHTKS